MSTGKQDRSKQQQQDRGTYTFIALFFAVLFLLHCIPPPFSDDVTLQRAAAPTAAPHIRTAAPSAIPTATPAAARGQTQPTAPPTAAPSPTEAQILTYVLNTNTKRFHLQHCSSAAQIKEKNRSSFTGTREELLTMGYVPCGVCHP